ncbi:MAG: hypothetical protein KJ904_11165 [Alphaproteobacteria bacterium]|nr:hypothetical protein [Alphaproteobacteria bacterium]MBU0797519.1 hypothetical protein [Alphaproteobacteria bacterium]MBU0887718.1 hypothetical protein [Alphaproteobacteria bacterium]MBU1813236.1 hypothetical protein [Alphaproteobacteria bacterium]
MATEFNLPGSSFEEIEKILKGYSHAPEQASLDQLSKLIGLHVTSISRNSKFLTDIGLIGGGMKKSTTDLGKRLGRALEHKQEPDTQSYWREAVQTNEKVSGLVTTVRIKGGMTEKDFSGHVLYVSGQKNTSSNRTGARCVVDVLLAANLLKEENGKLVVSSPLSKDKPADLKTDIASSRQPIVEAPENGTVASLLPLAGIPKPPNLTPQVAINIQLHLPETENAEVYEKLFKALREHLLSPKD